MYKTYFRQAVGMLKQNPFISVISILGTALAIMMIMTMIVTFQIKNASVAPEAFRDRTLYLVSFAVRDTSGGNKSYQSYGGLPYDALKNYIVPAMKTPELVVATVNNVAVVKREGAKDALYQSVRGTDADYWKLYTHTFTAGKPYARDSRAVGNHGQNAIQRGGSDREKHRNRFQLLPGNRHRTERISAVPGGL